MAGHFVVTRSHYSFVNHLVTDSIFYVSMHVDTTCKIVLCTRGFWYSLARHRSSRNKRGIENGDPIGEKGFF